MSNKIDKVAEFFDNGSVYEVPVFPIHEANNYFILEVDKDLYFYAFQKKTAKKYLNTRIVYIESYELKMLIGEMPRGLTLEQYANHNRLKVIYSSQGNLLNKLVSIWVSYCDNDMSKYTFMANRIFNKEDMNDIPFLIGTPIKHKQCTIVKRQ